MKTIDKKQALELTKILIKSCEEGYSGDWDSSTDEGKEGFDDMLILLKRIKEFIKVSK